MRGLAQQARAAPGVREVHSLRKALRRCRTLAGGIRQVDPAPGWREMLRAIRKVFRALGGLRDTHVLIEWLERLAPPAEPVARALLYQLNAREVDQGARVRQALLEFDPVQWEAWIGELAPRAARHPPGDPVYEHIAMLRLH
ncbi:MAG TPA: CHAD domain-containing protein, partial [Gammaproteobacteria bacterium]